MSPRLAARRPAPSAPPSARWTRLRAKLLEWYLKNRRDLPWRRTRDPYAIWISEIMLQQTRVETVLPYYERFLARFPDVRSLARAPEADVLALWSGLGYYSRARNLKEAASILARESAGVIPQDAPSLRRLPGIGTYTAAAIASVAFGRPAAAVDGNVVRVLSRIEGLRGRRGSPRLHREVSRVAEALASGPRPGDWTQALMELGATICLPRAPLCARCPARTPCLARRSGSPERFPSAASGAPPKPERRVMLLARRNGRVLLVPDPRAPGGTLSLPSARISRDGRQAARSLARRLGHAGELRGPISRFRHRTFSHDLSFEVWEVETKGSDPPGGPGRWISPARIEGVPTRSPTLKAVRSLRRKTGIHD